MAKKKKADISERRTETSEPKPKWTIMIYLAGDNSLTANCISVMQDLEAAKQSKDVEILACFDSNTPQAKRLALFAREPQSRFCKQRELGDSQRPDSSR